ncbi:MAG: TetR/AcrR family transcriptional regulator [Elainellaceae cyanobacterium]
MPRPREFDEDVVLDSAMQIFWLRGYGSTSLTALIEATGLQKGSLYKAFKDKHSLFITALERYLNEAYEVHRDRLGNCASPKCDLRQWLGYLIEVYSGYTDCRGCLAVNSLIELAPHDEAVKRLLQGYRSRLRSLLTSVIAQGQSQGEFRTDANADDLGLLMFHVLMGFFTSLKAEVPRDTLEQQADLVISMLEA